MSVCCFYGFISLGDHIVSGLHNCRNSVSICSSFDTKGLNILCHFSRHQNVSAEAEIQEKLKSTLKKRFQCVFEGLAQQGNPTLLNDIYTEIFITEGGSGKVNNDHEIRQIEAASRRPATQDTPIKCNDIFKPLPGQDRHIKSALTKGVAGIGKTISVQKFILDWAEGKANKDIQFIFPLPFRELNLMRTERCSLMELLQSFFMEIKESKMIN